MEWRPESRSEGASPVPSAERIARGDMEYPLLQRTKTHYTTAQFFMLVFARFIWNSGNSLIGFVGALGGWLITVLARRRWASAITLGDVVLYAGSELVPILPASVLESA